MIRGISSKATQHLLAELAAQHQQRTGVPVQIESVGGVDAARRVQAGEAFDLVILASDAIDRLLAAGALRPGSRVDLVRSGVAVAVPAGAPAPDISTPEALRAAVAAAPSLAVSTGPSGVGLLALFEQWGLGEQIRARLVQPPPGSPVGALVASGQVALGFQQLSELLPIAGLQIVGPLPAAVQIDTVFSGAIGAQCQQVAQAEAVLQGMAAPDTAALKQRLGMASA